MMIQIYPDYEPRIRRRGNCCKVCLSGYTTTNGMSLAKIFRYNGFLTLRLPHDVRMHHGDAICLLRAGVLLNIILCCT